MVTGGALRDQVNKELINVKLVIYRTSLEKKPRLE